MSRHYISFKTPENIEVMLNVDHIVAVIRKSADKVELLTSTQVVYTHEGAYDHVCAIILRLATAAPAVIDL